MALVTPGALRRTKGPYVGSMQSERRKPGLQKCTLSRSWGATIERVRGQPCSARRQGDRFSPRPRRPASDFHFLLPLPLHPSLPLARSRDVSTGHTPPRKAEHPSRKPARSCSLGYQISVTRAHPEAPTHMILLRSIGNSCMWTPLNFLGGSCAWSESVNCLHRQEDKNTGE